MHCGEGPHNVHDMEAEGYADLILDKIASAMTSLGMNNACISQGEFFLGLGPEHAHAFARHGMERKDISGYLFNQARMPARRVPASLRGTRVGRVDEARRARTTCSR